jgi:lambda family phage minor tail protein L
MSVDSDNHAFEMGELVELYDLDATALGAASVYYFTPGNFDGAAVVWKGNTYTPIDIEATGFQITGEGTLPKPTFRATNVTRALMPDLLAYNDLKGAIVTRWRVFSKYLDGEAGADPDAHYPEDVYKIERKAEQDKHAISWELSPLTDYEGQKLPRRKMLRDYCTLRYRRRVSGAWDYTQATCPYTGTDYFDRQDNVEASAADDVCGKRLSSCQLRFTGKTPLPFLGFPGMARTRVYR